ncbi:type II restriction endonuclease [Nocardia fluminea]|uniref:Restriction endonuclease EcoRV n=1 Tax=Nocardia fluminea TaxID=134984 RepID=A0A2N3V6S6_9NOCA|nr:type II restriction endonuclease [Nocardia fluminea]PKV77317.1 restriction endonuclease EcoRV [Nocardia fluminea]
MTEQLDLEDWLRSQCAEYGFGLGGSYRIRGDHSWPLIARDETDLSQQLEAGGHILPLPKEPAALANVLEVGIVGFLVDRVEALDGAEAARGTERGYPDMEISGEIFGGGTHAVDIKVARRAVDKNGNALNRTQSPITLYTGNTYFKHPTMQFPGTLRPFNEYGSHLDVLGIYTLDEEAPGRVSDLDLIVQQPWKIASKNRSSSTREYIGAVKDIDALRDGKGMFETPEQFYTFWRNFKFKTAPVVVTMMAKKIAGES